MEENRVAPVVMPAVQAWKGYKRLGHVILTPARGPFILWWITVVKDGVLIAKAGIV